MRRFYLERGGKHVADGIQFSDGTCVMRWRGVLPMPPSTTVYNCVMDLRKIHLHEETSQLVWTSDAFDRAMIDAQQDSCENCPFASVGGLDKRTAMVTPKYISKGDESEYLRGYQHMARLMYGSDWTTCTFGWAPTITIPGGRSEADA